MNQTDTAHTEEDILTAYRNNQENTKAVVVMAEHAHHVENEDRTASASKQDVMQNIGEQLKNQRKAKGISLPEISEHTKIGKKYLEALEEGRYDVLPCETYIRGFLRAYAKYLEMDDDSLIKQYRSQKETVTDADKSEAGATAEERKSNQSIWIPLLSMIILAGAGAGLFLLWPNSQEETAPKQEAAVSESATPGAGIAQPVRGIPGPNDPMTLKIRSKEKTWITVMADGRQEPDITLSPGQERSWTAQDRFVLWTGNAGGIEVYFNGQLQPPLGQPNEVRKEVVFQRPVAEPAAPAPAPEPKIE